MALPAGVTRIPYRSVTFLADDNFPLANRYNNTASSDLLNYGNMWRADVSQAARQGRLNEAVLDQGELMTAVIGLDCRNWIVLDDNIAMAEDRTTLRPNSVYLINKSSSVDITMTERNFNPGDRVSFINIGTQYVDLFLGGVDVVSAGGTNATKIRLKAGGGNFIGTGFTLEYSYLSPGSGTFIWRLIEKNGTIGGGGGDAIALT